jgi:hypothetical protein
MFALSGSTTPLFKLVNPSDDTVASLEKVTEGVTHILADEIVHSKEAADLIG